MLDTEFPGRIFPWDQFFISFHGKENRNRKLLCSILVENRKIPLLRLYKIEFPGTIRFLNKFHGFCRFLVVLTFPGLISDLLALKPSVLSVVRTSTEQLRLSKPNFPGS